MLQKKSAIFKIFFENGCFFSGKYWLPAITITDFVSRNRAIIDRQINTFLTGERVPFMYLYTKAAEGGTPSTSVESYYRRGEIPFIKIDDLSSMYLTNNKDFISEQGLLKSSAWLVPEHSVIYSNGATIGAVSINTYPVATKQGILGVVPQKNVSAEFLYFLMSSTYFSKEVQRIVTEGTMKTAYLKDINKIECPLPPLDVQNKFTFGLLSLVDKVNLEKKILTDYRFSKQNLLNQLFI